MLGRFTWITNLIKKCEGMAEKLRQKKFKCRSAEWIQDLSESSKDNSHVLQHTLWADPNRKLVLDYLAG